MNDDDLLTIKDVVERTNGIATEANLRWYRATGQGGPRSGKLGRRVVYRRADVEEWIEKRSPRVWRDSSQR